jgi:hypothetical protein
MHKDTLEQCLQNNGLKIWNSVKDWAANRGDPYNPAIWGDILFDADFNGDEALSGQEAVTALEQYLNFEIADQFRGDFAADIGRKCGWFDVDEVDGLNQSELIVCLQEHGEWIWEELSFYKTLAVHWWQQPNDPVFNHEIYETIDFTNLDEAEPLEPEVLPYDRDWLLEETLDMLIKSEHAVHQMQAELL